MMTKEEMMDTIIKARGMEDVLTIKFCELCECGAYTDTQLNGCLTFMLNEPFDDEE